MFYDSKAGIAIATILALLLWWVPYIGPMVAGYMGGRKGGTLLRGALVGAVSCLAVVGIATATSVATAAVCSEYGGFIEGVSSQLYDKALRLQGYLETFVIVKEGSIVVDFSDYFLLFALSIIGGVFASQARREAAAIISMASEANAPREPRSVKACRENRTIAFHTYEDYARMSVNSASVSNDSKKPQPDARKPIVATRVEPAHADNPFPEAPVKVTQHVADSVPTSAVNETRTSTVPDQNTASSAPASSAGEYDFL